MFNKLVNIKTRVRIEDGVYNAILVSVEEGTRTKYNNPGEKEEVFKFRFLVIGPDHQDTELIKIVRKPTVLTPPEGTRRASGLYELLCQLAGRELTQDDLKQADEMVETSIRNQVVFRLTVITKESGWVDVVKVKRGNPLVAGVKQDAPSQEDSNVPF